MISLSGPVSCDRERVDAEAEERVADHLRQVLVGEERPDREDRLVVRAGVGEDVQVAVPRILPELLRDWRKSARRGQGAGGVAWK